jgi:hypothetical protein
MTWHDNTTTIRTSPNGIAHRNVQHNWETKRKSRGFIYNTSRFSSNQLHLLEQGNKLSKDSVSFEDGC